MSGDGVDKALIKTLVPMTSLSDSHLADIARKAVIEEHPKGRILFKRDEESRRLHYLLQGSVDLADSDFNITPVIAGEGRARSPLDNQQPHSFTAVTTSPVRILTVSKDYVDLVLTWDEAGSYVVRDLSSGDAVDDDSDWMSCLLQSYIFAQVPPANIQKLFARFEEVRLHAGDAVVKQGDPGDYFYVVKRGRAHITRRMSSEGALKDVTLAELRAGDVFGEDALIGDAPRNASVVMVTDGELMRLGKEDFRELLQDPVLQYIEFAAFKQLAANAQSRVELVDVRLPLEYKQGHLPGAISIPLHSIRQASETLDVDVTYVTTCDGGRRSTLAAYILSQSGFDAMVLKDPPEYESAA